MGASLSCDVAFRFRPFCIQFVASLGSSVGDVFSRPVAYTGSWTPLLEHYGAGECAQFQAHLGGDSSGPGVRAAGGGEHFGGRLAQPIASPRPPGVHPLRQRRRCDSIHGPVLLSFGMYPNHQPNRSTERHTPRMNRRVRGRSSSVRAYRLPRFHAPRRGPLLRRWLGWQARSA